MRTTSLTFAEFQHWLIEKKNRSQSSMYVTCSQIRKIVRTCNGLGDKYEPTKKDISSTEISLVDEFINSLPQRSRSPYRRSWDLYSEYSKNTVKNSSYKEENSTVRAILKKYGMKQPVNWIFTGEMCNGKHIIVNEEYRLRRMLDEEDFEYLTSGKKNWVKQKIWKNRIK
jgi:hypothetical protein